MQTVSTASKNDAVYLAAGLLVLGGLLLAATVPGVFTIDEPHHVVSVVSARHGQVGLPGTEGLTPSQELAYFDPTARSAGVTTPVTPSVPGLYAWLALPFSLVGARGLFALNTLAFLATIALVWIYTRDHAETRWAPWLAAATFGLGAYAVEYAMALWPHMLAVALATAAFVAAGRFRHGGGVWLAAAAGLAAGGATGVRYQNIVFAGAVGLTILFWSRRRILGSALYGAGLALPLAVNSATNYFRFGSWNPLTKGPGYLKSAAGKTVVENPLVEAVAVFWARVVDYSARPAQKFGGFALEPSPDSGAFVFFGTVKKAWLQSLPWVLIPLVALFLAWVIRRRGTAGQATELRALSLPVGMVLAVFAAAGFGRTDGLCFNQRYFHELVPLMAVALAWTVERYRLARQPVLTGVLVAGALFVAARHFLPTAAGQVAMLRVPLALAAVTGLGWAVARFRGRAGVLAFSLGACLMWSAGVHLGDDLPSSRLVRTRHAAATAALARALPDEPAAVFTWRGTRNDVAPLQLARDYVILDLARDLGEAAPALTDELLARGRRVFVVTYAAQFPAAPPPDLVPRMADGRRVRPGSFAGLQLLEIMAR